MRRLGAVQQKIPCVFLTEVKEEQSRKRDRQQFQVVATETVNPVAVEANVDRALATEKLDGTCCYVTLYKGRPHLWARLDRKPNKQAEKRFRRHRHAHSCEGFSWSVEDDFKAVPETWIPAHRVRLRDGLPVPDPHGHIPGWVPLDKDNKQYCWHAAAVDAEARWALVLRAGPAEEDEDALEVAAVPLADLLEQTLELIGTNINGNPYGLGSRKQPLHFLVSHGTVSIKAPPPLDLHRLRAWFLERPAGRVEGVVWHCDDGTLVKVHRHHLGLRWPDGGTALADRPVVVTMDDNSIISNTSISSMDLFTFFSRLNGHRFSRLLDIK